MEIFTLDSQKTLTSVSQGTIEVITDRPKRTGLGNYSFSNLIIRELKQEKERYI